MAVLLNSLEGGTSGTTISNANSGGASGNAIDTPSVGPSAVLAFDNAHAAHGGLGLQCSVPAATFSFAYWGTSLGAGQAQVWFRVYLYATSAPAANARAVTFWTTTSAGTLCGAVLLNTAGKIIMQNSGSTTILTSANSFPLNQWFRVEGFLLASATAGQLEFRLFNGLDDPSVLETQTSTALQNTGASVGSTGFGISNSPASGVGPYWIDDFGVSTTGYLGPAVTAGGSFPRTRPGLTWLRRFRHRQIPQQAAAVTAVPAAASGTLDISATAAGAAPASAGGSLTLTGTAAAQAPAAASGALALTATATATGPGVTASGALVITGTAAAAAPAAGAGSITLAGTAAVAAPAAAAGSLAIAGAAAAKAPAAAAGNVVLSGTAVAAAPAAAAGSLVLTGTAAATGPGSTASGALALAGTATAQAPAAAAAAVTLTGSGTARAPAAAAGLLALSGTAAARAPATAAGTITLTGTATGGGPPPPLLNATSSPAVTELRDGTDTVTAARTSSPVAADPRDGARSVTAGRTSTGGVTARTTSSPAVSDG